MNVDVKSQTPTWITAPSNLMLLQCECVCSSVAQSHWRMWGWHLTHCSVSAVAGTHLEGETHAHGARSALLPQTDHLWPQVPPQQKHPAQRPQTRYASAYTGRNVAFTHTLASQESAGKCHVWNADGTNVFVSFRQLLCQREHGAAAGRLRPRCQAGDSGAEEKVSILNYVCFSN